MARILKWIYYVTIDYTARFFRLWTHCICVLLHLRRKKSVPPPTNQLLLKSATALAAEIREGRVKSQEVIRSYVQRIQEVEPYINATVDKRFLDALEEAKAADVLVASGAMSREEMTERKPLLGVPFTVKSLIGVKGLSCTSGSLLFADVRAAEDAEVVRLMKEAGAICLATTNTAEIGMGFETFNHINGKTCNPYDTTKTSGGSSGGEGALVSAAGSVIGIGNDLAGSIRLPCFYNGIFGHKPTRGAVSNLGVFPVPEPKLHDYLSTGPMCRYAEDLVLTMRVLNYGTLIPMKFGRTVDFSKVNIYCKYSVGKIPAIPKLDGEYRAVFQKALDYFKDTHGNDIKEMTSPDLSKTAAIVIHSLVSSSTDLTKTLTGGKGGVNNSLELFKYFFGLSRFTLGPLVVMNISKIPLFFRRSKVAYYDQLLRDIDNELQSTLDDNSVILMPTFPQTAPYHNETLFLLWSTCYTAIFNILGMPATQCTLGLNSRGMPLGLQVIGRRGNDALTVAFAVELEKAFGGWTPPKEQA